MRTFISLIAALAVVGQANAIQMDVDVLSVYQEGNGAVVRFGHVVSAGTNYNRLGAGGSFSAQCAHQAMNWPITGGRSLFTENLVGGLRLVVTIPAQLPARRTMPGFSSLPRGTTVYCNYNWTAAAAEGAFTIGLGGTSFQGGNGNVNESDAEPFIMNVPGTTDPNENSVCIP